MSAGAVTVSKGQIQPGLVGRIGGPRTRIPPKRCQGRQPGRAAQDCIGGPGASLRPPEQGGEEAQTVNAFPAPVLEGLGETWAKGTGSWFLRDASPSVLCMQSPQKPREDTRQVLTARPGASASPEAGGGRLPGCIRSDMGQQPEP